MRNPFLDGMPLPVSSTQEDLETISKNKLSLLFDPALFEIREELKRDKGVDLVVELKHEGRYTNFRFIIQLKSTSSIATNRDGSISYPVEVSNVHYLVNYGMPSYYILYEHSSGKFYLEYVNHVYNNLMSKYGESKQPKQFKVRFSKPFTPELMQDIYRQTFDNGTLLRKLMPHLKVQDTAIKQQKGIVIDGDNDVYSVEQNMAFIEQFGFDLLNHAAFLRIVEIEQRTHPRTSAPAIFNLVCGVAYYQRSNLFKAMELLKLAQQEITSFSPDIQSMLTYTLTHAKYLLGMMDEQSFKSAISKVMEFDNLGSFLELEKANKTFLDSIGKDRDRINAFYKTTEQVLREDQNNKSSHVMAYAQLLHAESKILVNDYSKNVVYIIGRVKDYGQTKLYKAWTAIEAEYSKRLKTVFDYAFHQENFLGMTNLGMDKMHWIYTRTFLNHIFSNWDKHTRTVDRPVSETDKESLLSAAAYIDKLSGGYEALYHNENLVSALSTKYELLHLAGHLQEAANTAERIREIIEANDFNGLRNKYHELVNGGTGYETFLQSFTAHLDNIFNAAKACGLEQYMLEDIPAESLVSMEEDLYWSIEKFYEFSFPE